MTALIELNFFYKNKNIDRYRLSFQKEIQNIIGNRIKIKIPNNVFRHGKGKHPIKITLFKINSDFYNDYYFHIYYGKNCAYVQLDELNNHSYEIILRAKGNLKILNDETIFTELDTIENLDKKRLVLINYGTFLKINNLQFDLIDIIQSNCNLISSSYQLSEIDVEEKKFIVKPFEKFQDSSLAFLINKKSEYTKFGEDFDDLLTIQDDTSYINKLTEIKEKYAGLFEYDFIRFNKLNVFLDEKFKECKDLTLKLFFDFFSCLFFFEYRSNFISINTRAIIINYINHIKQLFEEIDEHTEISMSEKVRALNALFMITNKFDKISDINSLKIKYYIISNPEKDENKEERKNLIECEEIDKEEEEEEECEEEKEYEEKEEYEEEEEEEEDYEEVKEDKEEEEKKNNNKYILGKVADFFEKYIANLNEKSAVYENFLFLDGGYGYYNYEEVYTYDMTNLKILKSHLTDILPQILVFCYNENEEIAFTTPEFGGIVINEYHFLKKYKDDLNSLNINYSYPSRGSEKLTEDQIDDIAMDIVLDLIHESMGHKKYLLVGQGILSPKKIIKNKELIELKHINEYNSNNANDNSEYVLTSKKDKNKGDSGHFLELAYGKVDNTLITKLLFDMKNKGKLIHRPDLFTDKGETLKKYVYLRKIIEEKKINFNFKNKLSIEEEIKAMNNAIDNFKKNQKNEGKINVSSCDKKKIEENPLLLRKRNLEKSNEDDELKSKNKKKKYNTTDSIDISKSKKEDSSTKIDTQFWSIERLKNTPRQQIIEISKQRVRERFNFKFDERIRHNMIQKLKELNPNDPYYQDLIFLIGEYRIIV